MQFDNAQNLEGATVYGADSDKIGTVQAVYQDEATGKPEWVAVSTGWFGNRVSLVPLAAATPTEDGLRIPFDKDRVKSAPHSDPEGRMSTAEEAELFEYYGVPYGGETVTATGSPGASSASTGDAGHDTSGPNTDDAMTRSEERLHVGTENVETGRARLRKYVVTEHVQQTVPVTHEEVRLEREPITDANVDAAMDGPTLSEEEHEITLHEERPVVAKETVPVERIRLTKDQVADEAAIDEEVRHEEIDGDGVYPTGTTAGSGADTPTESSTR